MLKMHLCGITHVAIANDGGVWVGEGGRGGRAYRSHSIESDRKKTDILVAFLQIIFLPPKNAENQIASIKIFPKDKEIIQSINPLNHRIQHTALAHLTIYVAH